MSSSSSPKKMRAVATADNNSLHGDVVPVQIHAAKGAALEGMKAYKKMYEESIKDPAKFWGKLAKTMLTWDKDFNNTSLGSFGDGDVSWFQGGRLNACVQCLDRHVWNESTADKPAIVWEGDEVGTTKTFTFRQALHETCRIANVLKAYGVRPGDAVTLYMPMVPEIVFCMLACARLGAPHSVVFAGFSAEALRDRVSDVQSRFVFTCDEGLRGGKIIPLKNTVDEALKSDKCKIVEKVFVFKRTGSAKINFVDGRDVWMNEELPKHAPYCPAVDVDSEHPLFYLYTSGSTGKPKGVQHTTAGYMLYAQTTHKYVFDPRPDDVYACVADCGWITGHSYIVYGPLANCTTTLLFESTPLYPTPARYWDLVERHKVTIFYTAPTAIRALMREGISHVQKHNLSSLRVLGSVGEPIGPAPWRWYFENVGSSRCPVLDTFWQTETGGIMMTPLPGVTPMKPGSCCLPFLGVDPVLLDPQTGLELKPVSGESQHGVLCFRKQWPGMTRTVRGDHVRYMATYFDPYKGYYFTGDGATRDEDGYYWITGRVDDVMNVSGHRVGSAELESAINAHAAVAESAILGFPHEIKGEGIACFVILKAGHVESAELIGQLRLQVRTVVGAFATPDQIIISPGLPKTRSGKIMRRILRKIVSNEASPEQLGDITTLADPSVVEALIDKYAQLVKG